MSVDPVTYINFEDCASQFAADVVGNNHARLLICTNQATGKFGSASKGPYTSNYAAYMDFWEPVSFKTVTFWAKIYSDSKLHTYLGGTSATYSGYVIRTAADGLVYFGATSTGLYISQDEGTWEFFCIRESTDNNTHVIRVNGGAFSSDITTGLAGEFQYFGPVQADTNYCSPAIDDIRVFDSILSDAQVSEIYADTVPYTPADPKPQSYFPYNAINALTILSNNNRTVTRGYTGTTAPSKNRMATTWPSGDKYYMEFYVNSLDTCCSFAGIATASTFASSYVIYSSSVPQYSGYAYRFSDGYLATYGTYTALGDPVTAGDVLMIAYDGVDGKLWFGVNGVWQGGGDPAAGTNPAVSDGSSMTANTFYAVCQQSVTTTYGTNTITARIYESEFDYSIPSGFSTPEDPYAPQHGDIAMSLSPLEVLSWPIDVSGDIAMSLSPLEFLSSPGTVPGDIALTLSPLSFESLPLHMPADIACGLSPLEVSSIANFTAAATLTLSPLSVAIWAPYQGSDAVLGLQPLTVSITVGTNDLQMTMQALSSQTTAIVHKIGNISSSLKPLSFDMVANTPIVGVTRMAMKPLSARVTAIRGEVAHISITLRPLSAEATDPEEVVGPTTIACSMAPIASRTKAAAPPIGLPTALQWVRRQLR